MRWVERALRCVDAAQPAMWVAITSTRGSAPRAAGAAMLVTADDAIDTIGGGTLEFRAIALARALLARDAPAAHVQVPLGPSLGQCCGGRVTLSFTRLTAAHRPWLAAVAHAVSGPAAIRVALDVRPPLPVEAVEQGGDIDLAVVGRSSVDCAPASALTLELRGPVLPVLLFGAGHVGRALVQALAPLPVAVTWIDPRDDIFPDALPLNVRAELSDVPLADVAAAVPGTAFVVMTHLHSLDEDIAFAALARGDAAFVGVIGSASKRARFERRFAARGLAPTCRARMQMPIGQPTAGAKEPEVIAISIAAELMQVRAAWQQARQCERQPQQQLAQHPQTTIEPPWHISGPTSSTG